MNYGLIKDIITPNDWIAGSYTPLGGVSRIVDWENYLPVVEHQNNFGWDRWACVSYATLNWLEVMMRYETGVEHNFSDRFLASASETKVGFGNYLVKVFDMENKHYGIDKHTAHTAYKDIRHCHMTPQNNLIFANMVKEWLLGNPFVFSLDKFVIPSESKSKIFLPLKK